MQRPPSVSSFLGRFAITCRKTHVLGKRSFSVTAGIRPTHGEPSFPGNLTVLESHTAADDAMARLGLCLQWSFHGKTVVGLDCEWGRVGKGQKLRGVDLVQIAPSLRLEDSVIVRCTNGVPESLQMLLEDSKILKVVVGATDATLLHRSGVRLQGGVDLQRVLRILGLHKKHGVSLASMYRSLCGKDLCKDEQRSNWGTHSLSKAQVLYAARDAVAALEVLRALSAQHMVLDSEIDKFATFFVDSFTLDSKGNLVRDSLAKAALAAMEHEDVPKSLKDMLLQTARTRPLSRGKSGGGFYAVAVGRVPGVYKSWADCSSQVKGFSGARYKKFTTEVEAEAFVESE